MKAIHILFLLFLSSIFWSSCKPSPEKDSIVELLTNADSEAVGPYFTKDHLGNPVLCWTELNNQDSLYRLKYAIYNSQDNVFDEPITVIGSEGSSIAAESMGKVAFKSDGTVIALFNKRFENAKSRFASAIYYTLSNDGGNNWTIPQFIHSETSEAYGRSFFNMCTLADGEVAAIWLDGRFPDEKGSALFFSRTEKGRGFGVENCLDKSTCECCRTEILTDGNGGIHIAYRGIQFPFENLGKQVRDMVYSFSNDHGKTFIPSKSISKDNWEIEGCPHTGPSLASTKDGMHALWFTGGGVSGLYLSSLEDANLEFKDKIQLSKEGRHPQMVSLNDNSLAMVWDEVMPQEQNSESEPKKHSHTDMMAMEGHASPEYSRIVITLFTNGKIDRQFPLSHESQIAHHPVIAPLENGVLAAWVNEEVGRPGIAYSFIEVN
jgi:hypothetical protein